MTDRDGSAVSDAPNCVCGRPKSYHTARPAALGAPWHRYTIPTGRHERGCLVISGPHDAALCRSLWADQDGGEDVPAQLDKAGEQRHCGYMKRHPAHTFMRLEVLFQCPGEHGAEGNR